ncbi:obscurin-like isoform X2 [Liolophura sinensis]|uniref:obscurin-like isoform X2 n=1 Tax=Liolophura sinensis TaxID=3198878 RepID=UPI003158DE85
MDKPSVFEESPDVFAVSWAPARIPAYSKPSKIRYIIEKREPPSHDWTRVASNITDTRHTVKGLKPDKDIMFRIRAESDFGVSDPTLAASVNRRPVITIPPRTKDIEEESLMLAPSTFISGTVGTATAPRAPTGRPTISEVKDTTLELSWFPARVPAYMKQTPVTYSVEIREPPSTNWAPLVSGLKETGYSVENLKPKKDYMFRVRAENEHGTSEPTLPAILERPPEPKPEVERRMTPRNTPQRTLPKRRTPSMERDTTPLRFTSREATPLRYTSREPTPLRKGSISGLPVPAELIAPFDSDIQYGVEGQQAQICLGLRGFPLPTIQWFFKGKPLENDDKYSAFISPGGEATLTVNDVCPADIGEYKCNAENEHGVAVKIVQLDLADPPTFIEPLKDITIIAKNSGVLECRVDGIPYPEVKWNKDWRPLVESSRVFMDHESPDYWSLSLSSALKTDGGLYACIAENVAGKVHCVANVIVEDQAPSKTTLKYKQANIEDHFHILEEKGRGRTSIVRRVIEKSTGKEFAAKFIQVRDPGDKDVFKHELECLRLASHKNIVAIQDAYETERRLVLVSELVSGPELLDKVVSESTWTESDAAYFIKQTLDLLQHLHSEGVVVVDLKPWDILLSIPGSDEVKLVDLGFARRLAASRDVRTSYGTAEFVAPEVVASEPLSPSADVWSVGVLAYILLSGISPFYNHSDRATLLTVQGADWDFDAKAFENISKEARDFISKVLLKEAGERLTIGECLDHPWMKNAIKRGQGLKINVTNHKALNDRYRTMRSSTVVKTVADIRPLGKQTEAVDESGLQSEVDPATGDTVYPDSQAYGEYLDEETWLDWQTRYQHGPGTQLMPLKETDLPLRIREYRRQKRGEMPREARSPSRESEMGEDRKMMKERLLVADVEAEFEPSPSRRKEFEWIVQPEEVKEARRRTSSESESQPQKTVGVRTEEGFSPIFLEKLKDAAYLVGEDVTFSCHVMANPAPSITWYRNEGMLSDGQRIRTSLTEDGRASITVLNTMPNDVGVYKCIVRNKLGTVTSRARLLLGDNPERPGRPVVCAVSSDEALLVWNAPKSDGNSYITNYRVDYRKAGEDRWTSAVSVLDECALVPRLKPSTIYRFRVSCSNRFGVSPFSWSSVEVRTKAPGAPAVSIDEEIERLLLRSRKALEKPSPRESAVRSPSLMRLETIEEEMKTTSPEEEFNFGEDIRKGAFSSIKCVSKKVGGEELVAKMAAGDSKKKDELIREFSVLRPLQQENIVRLVSGYQTPQQVCLIMERLYGDNVVQHLSFKNTYTEESVAFIIQQVLDAVQYLHHCGVAHLNLQPSSVMLASRRRLDVKIVDFSLARSITSPEGSHMPKMGFPDFLSPEMVAQEKVGFAADVWTIGALTFLLLSGESPFLGETDLETFANIAYIRYDAQDLYENVTKEGLKFIYDLLKRLPRNRLGVEECLDHKWLQLTPNMVKARQEAVFLSNKLRRYAKDYHQKRLERSGVFILSSTPPPLTSKPKITEVPALSEKKDSKPSVKETKEESVAAEVKKVKPKSPSPEPKPKTPSPEPVKEIKPKTPSPEPKPKTPSPEPIQEEVKPKTPSPEPVQEVKPRTPTPEPKPKTPSPGPVQEVKPRTPTTEPKPKTPSPEPMKEEVKPKTPSPEPVQEEVKPKTPSPEPVTKPEESEIGEETEANTQPIIKEVSSEERSPVSSVEEKSETGVDVVEMEAEEGGTTSEEVQISLYTTEEPVTPIPGPTPERENVDENIEAIMEMSEEGAVTQADTSVKLEGSVEVTASQSQSQTVVEYSEESSSTSHTIQMSSVVESRQSSSAETAEEVSVQFSTSSETVEEVVLNR